MARTDPTEPATSGDGDSISSAARALADATAALTRMLGKQVQVVGDEVSETIASSLREASRGLADASDSVAKHAGRSRAEDRRREKVDRTGDIAADAGYTKGALYAHFGSKNELFLEVARQKIAAAPDQACLPPLDADGLEPEVVDALEQMYDDEDLLLALEFLSYAVRHPEARAEIGAFYEEGFGQLAAQIAQRRHPADATPTRDDWDTALAVTSISNIALLVGAVTGSPHASPAASARLIARLLRG
jgi:AcrR family transcriptional regulator